MIYCVNTNTINTNTINNNTNTINTNTINTNNKCCRCNGNHEDYWCVYFKSKLKNLQ